MRSAILMTLLSALLVVLVAACGGSDGGDAGPQSGGDIYAASCATCHADDGSGFVGPPLVGVHDRLSVPEIETVIADGRAGEAGSMPAWSGRYTDEEISAVAEYLRSFG